MSSGKPLLRQMMGKAGKAGKTGKTGSGAVRVGTQGAQGGAREENNGNNGMRQTAKKTVQIQGEGQRRKGKKRR